MAALDKDEEIKALKEEIGKLLTANKEHIDASIKAGREAAAQKSDNTMAQREISALQKALREADEDWKNKLDTQTKLFKEQQDAAADKIRGLKFDLSNREDDLRMQKMELNTARVQEKAAKEKAQELKDANAVLTKEKDELTVTNNNLTETNNNLTAEIINVRKQFEEAKAATQPKKSGLFRGCAKSVSGVFDAFRFAARDILIPALPFVTLGGSAVTACLVMPTLITSNSPVGWMGSLVAATVATFGYLAGDNVAQSATIDENGNSKGKIRYAFLFGVTAFLFGTIGHLGFDENARRESVNGLTNYFQKHSDSANNKPTAQDADKKTDSSSSGKPEDSTPQAGDVCTLEKSEQASTTKEEGEVKKELKPNSKVTYIEDKVYNGKAFARIYATLPDGKKYYTYTYKSRLSNCTNN